jgi:phenylpyruvate tautomerase PptA (4-oxalocrotonate tautomerase family)
MPKKVDRPNEEEELPSFDEWLRRERPTDWDRDREREANLAALAAQLRSRDELASRRRLRVIMIAAAVNLAGLAVASYIAQRLGTSDLAVRSTLLLSFLAIVATGGFLYLQGTPQLQHDEASFRAAHRTSVIADDVVELAEQVRRDRLAVSAEIAQALSRLRGLDAASRDELVERLTQSIARDTGTEVYKQIYTTIQEIQKRDQTQTDIAAQIQASDLRLRNQIVALSKQGNLNLILGGFTTAVGLVLLGMFVYLDAGTTRELADFINHFMPRATLVALIEVFAYFFLKLYKASLTDIKYFQNELTNHESKVLALRVANVPERQSMLPEVIKTLLATERNHILEKGQTTAEIERARLERANLTGLAAKVAQIVKATRN